MTETSPLEPGLELEASPRRGSGFFYVLLLLLFTIFFSLFFCFGAPSGAYLTSGDGYTQALPTFFGRHVLWEPNIMMGYPLFADPNQAFWYPLLWVCRQIPNGFNIYVIAPFVIGAFGLAAFIFVATESRSGAIVGGIVFSFSGYMISHQGHVNIIHPSAWAVYLLLSVELLHKGRVRTGIFIGVVSAALSAVSGPQQPLVFITPLVFAYALFRSPGIFDKKLFLCTMWIVLLAILVAGVSLVPAIELSSSSTRAHMTYAQYIAFATKLPEFPIRLVFPYFFGATPSPLFTFSHENVGAFSETSNYVGLTSLILAAVALVSTQKKRLLYFWISAALVATWLSLGNSLFAAEVAFHIPVYNLFRIPGRHAFEFTICCAVLAAFGAKALEERLLSRSHLTFIVLFGFGTFLGLFGVVALYGNSIRTYVAGNVAVPTVPLTLADNNALLIPALTLLVAFAGICAWSLVSDRRLANAIGVLTVFIDLGTFSYNAYWHYTTVPSASLQPPAKIVQLREDLRARGQRLFAAPGSAFGALYPSNLPTLWNLPTLGGYVSLEDSLLATEFDMDPTGTIPIQKLSPDAMDLANVGFVFLPHRETGPRAIDVEFAEENIDLFVGGTSIAKNGALKLSPSVPFTATRVDLISSLGRSAEIPNNSDVAELVLRDASGAQQTFPIRAGRDTAESAYDRPDVRPLVKHLRAVIFGGEPFAHTYQTHYAIHLTRPIADVTVAWNQRLSFQAAMTIQHLALVNEPSKSALLLGAESQFYGDSRHWQRSALAFSDDTIFERREDQRKSVWLESAPKRASTSAELVRLPLPGVSQIPASAGTVREVETRSPIAKDYDVSCAADCELVTSDIWYPGWVATIDGKPTAIYRAHSLLKAVSVPTGRHAVAIDFVPLSLRVGLSATGLGFLLLFATVIPVRELWSKRRRIR